MDNILNLIILKNYKFEFELNHYKKVQNEIIYLLLLIIIFINIDYDYGNNDDS